MAKKRWVVEDAGATIEDVVARMGEATAAADGRAFVNGARASAGRTLTSGDVIETWDARATTGAPLAILYRTEDVVAVDKPPELPTIADHRGTDSVASRLAAQVALDEPPHAISRLDVGVSGVVLFAISAAGRRTLDESTRAGTLEKTYVGVAKGGLADRGRATAKVDGKAAATRFFVLGRARGACLVALRLETGRLHQIREHLAGLGAPLFGDKKRRGSSSIVAGDGRVVPLDRILLHAHRARLTAPAAPVEVVAPVPASMREAWSLLDGDDAAWNDLGSVEP